MDERPMAAISANVDTLTEDEWIEKQRKADGFDEFGRSKKLLDWNPIDFGKLTTQEREACYELFRRGDISWLLHPGQQALLDWIEEHRRELAVVVTSRQWGKTVASVLYCMVHCIKHPKHSVLYVAPHKRQLDNIMIPKLNFILQFLPDDLLPHKRDMTWTFPNGSTLRLDGVSVGHAVRLRGDTVHLVVMDECRDIADLQNVIEAHISPMLTTTNGKIVMISTPPESPLHAFTDYYIRDAIKRNDLFRATYKDNPLLPTERLKHLFNVLHPKGEDDHVFRREYMADETVTDPDKLIIREWNPSVNDEFFRTYPGPPNPVRPYFGIDYGFSDPCGIVAGYLDYMQGCLIITHEHVARKMNTDDLGEKLIEIENLLRLELPGMIEPIRVIDIDPSLASDLFSRFSIRVEPTFKVPSIITMLNRLRVAFLQGKIRVHPRCKELRFQLSAGVFTKKEGSTEYLRTDRGGHNDALDALRYVNLNCRWNEIVKPEQGLHVGRGQMLIGGFAQPKTFRDGVLNRPK